METFAEIIKYTLPSLILFLSVYFMVRSFFKNETEKRAFELRNTSLNKTLPLRLQAYERLTLFLERITPGALIRRLGGKSMPAKQQYMALVLTIRTEFEHNIAQQIYISPQLWSEITKAKEEMLAIVNRVFASLPPQAKATDLNTRLLQYFVQNEEPIPSVRALKFIDQEVKKIL